MKVLFTTLIILLQCMNMGCTNKNDVIIIHAPEEIKALEDTEESNPKETILEEASDIQEHNAKQNKETIEYLKSIANNDLTADELITTLYKEDELKPFVRLDSLFKEYPPECVRISNDMFYFIYKYEENNYLFIMYNSEDINSFPSSSWNLGKKLYCRDFENLAERNASFNEIREFAPYGDYTSYYVSVKTPLYSLHHTVDGCLIRLDYSCEIGESLRVNRITKFSEQDNPIFYNLLTIDKELINKVSE